MKYIFKCLLAVTFFSFALKVKAITNIKVNDYEDPEESCVRGLGSVLADNKYKQYGYSMKTRIFK